MKLVDDHLRAVTKIAERRSHHSASGIVGLKPSSNQAGRSRERGVIDFAESARRWRVVRQKFRAKKYPCVFCIDGDGVELIEGAACVSWPESRTGVRAQQRTKSQSSAYPCEGR